VYSEPFLTTRYWQEPPL